MKIICRYIARHRFVLPFIISLLLFVIPFFWLQKGFVDLGGDSMRLYFLDPASYLQSIYRMQTPAGMVWYAFLPYAMLIYVLRLLTGSATNAINVEHGIQLAMAFFSSYLVLGELLSPYAKKNSSLVNWVAVVSGVVYMGFITKAGWETSLVAQNQIFLNPLIFYLLLRLCITRNFGYAIGIVALSGVYSGNFGYQTTPQIFSFYPLSVLFLFLYIRYFLHRQFPWNKVLVTGVLFVGLQAFHLVPTIGSLLNHGSALNVHVFSRTSQQKIGLNYFDVIHQEYGKLSTELFQPAKWHAQTFVALLIPVIAILGFLKKRSRLLTITGIFFAITFYLLTANITHVGVQVYRMLFYIPGFLMFRQFDDKWYYVFVFFYTILFGVSFYTLVHRAKFALAILAGLIVAAGVLYRIVPFFQGTFYKNYLYESRSVPYVFTVDPDLLPALAFAKSVPDDGNFLTLPLTFPIYQVIYGAQGGAYDGPSMVQFLSSKHDYAGFWTFGPYEEPVTEALRNGEPKPILQLFSLLNIRYIFRDTDPRVMDNFPTFPYYRYNTSSDISVIDNQTAYDQLLKTFPVSTMYEKGFFRIMEFDDTVVRPKIYIPDVIYASASGVLSGDSFRSAYIDRDSCSATLRCGVSQAPIPHVNFRRVAPETYAVNIDVGARTEPFIVILSEDYDASWSFELNGKKLPHMMANGYANGWIIDPVKFKLSGKTTGVVSLGFQKYFAVGRVVSGVTIVVITTYIVWVIARKKYEKR